MPGQAEQPARRRVPGRRSRRARLPRDPFRDVGDAAWVQEFGAVLQAHRLHSPTNQSPLSLKDPPQHVAVGACARRFAGTWTISATPICMGKSKNVLHAKNLETGPRKHASWGPRLLEAPCNLRTPVRGQGARAAGGGFERLLTYPN